MAQQSVAHAHKPVRPLGKISESSALVDEVAHILRQNIRFGEYSPHSRFPSERTLAESFEVSVRVMRKAIQQLVDEGILYRIERSGTFVRGIPPPAEEGTPAPFRCLNVIQQKILPPPPADLLDFVQADYLAGYTEVLDPYDIRMRFMICPDNEEAYETLLSPRYALKEQACIIDGVRSAPLFNWLHEKRIPFVLLQRCQDDTSFLPPHHGVYINRNGAGFKAVQYLLNLGHERIGFLGTTIPDRHRRLITYRGFEAGLIAAGLFPRQEYTVHVHTDRPGDALGPAMKLLGRKDRPTAVVCQNDGTALGVLEAARKLGIRVPEELSVIGFNDQPEAALADPPLTTFANPRRQLARAAVEILLSVVEDEFDTYRTQILECELVVRESVAPPE